MKRTCVADRLSGADVRRFWMILLPVIAENFINALFGVADTVMLGQSANAATAIAAVGVTTSSINLVVCVVIAFCTGITVFVAQRYGCRNLAACRRAASRMLVSQAGIGLLLSVSGVLLAGTVIRFLGANEEIRSGAETYFRIVAAGFFFQTLNITVSAAFRGVGETRIPMVFNVGAGVINVLLNYCLINGHLGFPAMGIAGAAIATTFSKGVAAVAAVVCLLRAKTLLRPQRGDWYGRFRLLPEREILYPVLRIGLFSGAEQVVLQSGAVITTAIITVIPTVPFSAYQVEVSIESLVWALSGGFCVAATSLAGLYLGQGHPGKILRNLRMIWGVGMVTATLLMCLYLFAGRWLAGLYSDDEQIIGSAVEMMKIACVTMLGIFTHQCLSGTMRGINHPEAPLVSSLISLWVCRVVGCFVLVRMFGYGVFAVCVCCTADQLLRATINAVFFFRVRRRKLRPAAAAAATKSEPTTAHV